eukprot:m.25457 g.25457  ORF g.25457 m.25457 type:complete len:338 (+) comp4165_c0_seq1:3-1016(+)
MLVTTEPYTDPFITVVAILYSLLLAILVAVIARRLHRDGLGSQALTTALAFLNSRSMAQKAFDVLIADGVAGTPIEALAWISANALDDPHVVVRSSASPLWQWWSRLKHIFRLNWLRLLSSEVNRLTRLAEDHAVTVIDGYLISFFDLNGAVPFVVVRVADIAGISNDGTVNLRDFTRVYLPRGVSRTEVVNVLVRLHPEFEVMQQTWIEAEQEHRRDDAYRAAFRPAADLGFDAPDILGFYSQLFAMMSQQRALATRRRQARKRVLQAREQSAASLSLGTRAIDLSCAICLEDLDVTARVIVFPCDGQHVYHSVCLLSWLDDQDSCPVCRRPVEGE